MFDIGIGEILLIAVVGLLVFGPERLPRAAADAAKWLKQIRGMASSARQDLADSAGLDLSETMDTVRSLQDFHPRRLAASLLDEDAAGSGSAAASGSAQKAPQQPVPPTAAFDPDAT